jgi:fatty aldehyde-generating acyl-ACP reductase
MDLVEAGFGGNRLAMGANGVEANGSDVRRFAFLLHPLRIEDFTRKFPFVGRLPAPWVEAAFARVPPFTASHITGVRSLVGTRAEGWFIALPMTPNRLLSMPWPRLLPRLVRAGRKAEAKGARILGLGAFTKIVGDRGVSLNERLGIPVTIGNSYTAATAVEGALLAAERMGVDPAQASVAVVGGSGSIGAACAQVLASEVAQVTLVARDLPRLEAVAERVRARGAQVRVDTNARSAVGDADVVLAVTSATEEILHPEDFKAGAVVCDVARPRNVSGGLHEQRQDVLVIDGGVVAVPGPVDFGLNFGFPPGTCEACMAETMILALEGRYEPYTLGRDIDVERVEAIAGLGRKHGFRVAGLRRFERAITDDEIVRIRERAAAARRTQPKGR